MSETEKKSSTWPWIAVPVAAVSVFFLLRECQHRLPPAETTAPAPTDEAAAPATTPAPQ
jgi:hypothetical protein